MRSLLPVISTGLELFAEGNSTIAVPPGAMLLIQNRLRGISVTHKDTATLCKLDVGQKDNVLSIDFCSSLGADGHLPTSEDIAVTLAKVFVICFHLISPLFCQIDLYSGVSERPLVSTLVTQLSHVFGNNSAVY